MTQRVGSCPNCGAKIVFRWSSSVQTVCEYCKSILVRTDVDLKKVGQVADLPPDGSPIQLNTEGLYRNKSFVVVGRIVYEYDQGAWNEWHVMMNDGTSAWLSDAYGQGLRPRTVTMLTWYFETSVCNSAKNSSSGRSSSRPSRASCC